MRAKNDSSKQTNRATFLQIFKLNHSKLARAHSLGRAVARMLRATGIFSHEADANRECFSLVSGKRHSCARFRCPSGNSDSILVGAGTSDDSKNCVSVWNLNYVLECLQNERMLSESNSVNVNYRVTCTEFSEGISASGHLVMWAGLADGSVHLLEYDVQDDRLSLKQTVGSDTSNRPLHSAAVSAIAAHSQDPKCLSVGEDGKLFELRVTSGSISTTQWPEILDWMAVYDVKYGADGRSFFSAGGSGQLKMWDQRSLNRPKIFGGSEANELYFSIEPFDRADVGGMGAREEILLAGGSDGRVSVFDVRQVILFENAQLLQLI